MSAQSWLTQDQEHVANRLVSRIDTHLRSLSAIARLRVQSPGAADKAYRALKTPRVANAVGVFGRRGSGKSTVMVEVLQRLAKRSRTELCWHVSWRPLDLSYAPREFPHGLTVLHWLYERLQSESVESETGRRTLSTANLPSQRVRKAFERASHSYFRGADGFNEMVRDLAVSAEHYAQVAAIEISKRQSLRDDIQHWLDVQAEAMEVEGFVLGIDDLDLAPANRHQNLVWSLLDELHLDRLLFVVAGDLTRLERRLAEEDAYTRRCVSPAMGELDGQAAIDLAYKVFPQVDRAELRPWAYLEREEFRTQSPDPARKQEPASTLGRLLHSLKLSKSIYVHLSRLLPEWPRGLENLHRQLEELQLPQAAEGGHDGSPETEDALVCFLAESNFEFPLARQLRQQPLQYWAAAFSWPDDANHTATWAAVGAQLDAKQEIPALQPQALSSASALKLPEAQPRWAEMLLDIALHRRQIEPARLLERIPWLRTRMAEAQAWVERTADTVDRNLSDDPGGLQAALPWIRWNEESVRGQTRGVERFAVGLLPVLQWLSSERTLLPRSFDLWNLPATRRDPSPPSSKPLQLPTAMRPLLRVVNALATQPWQGLSRLGGELLPISLARLAAGLTYIGIRHAVAGENAPKDWSAPTPSPLAALADCIDSGTIWTDTEIVLHFDAVLDQADADQPLLQNGAEGSAVTLLSLIEATWFKALRRRSV